MDKVRTEKIKTAHFVFWDRIANHISKVENLDTESVSDVYNQVFNEVLKLYIEPEMCRVGDRFNNFICFLYMEGKYFGDDLYRRRNCIECCECYGLPKHHGCLGGLLKLFFEAVEHNYKVRAWRIAKIIADLVYEEGEQND